MTDVTKPVTNWMTSTPGHEEMTSAYLHQLGVRQDIVTILDALDAIAFEYSGPSATYAAFRMGIKYQKSKESKAKS